MEVSRAQELACLAQIDTMTRDLTEYRKQTIVIKHPKLFLLSSGDVLTGYACLSLSILIKKL